MFVVRFLGAGANPHYQDDEAYYVTAAETRVGLKPGGRPWPWPARRSGLVQAYIRGRFRPGWGVAVSFLVRGPLCIGFPLPRLWGAPPRLAVTD